MDLIMSDENMLQSPSRPLQQRRLSLGHGISTLSMSIRTSMPTDESDEDEIKDDKDKIKDLQDLQCRLFKITCMLFTFLLVMYVSIVLGVELVLNNGDMNNEENFETWDNPYQGIVEWTLPKVQNYYQELEEEDRNNLLSVSVDKQWSAHENNDAPCVDDFFQTLKENVFQTSPALVKLIVSGIGLSHSAGVRRHLKDLIESEQELSTFYTRSTECLHSNAALEMIACDVMEQTKNSASALDPDFLEFLVNGAVVLDSLTEAMVEDLNIVSEVVQVLKEVREKREDFYDKLLLTHNENDFFVHKYDGVVFFLDFIIHNLATNTRDQDQQNVGMVQFLQTNILEAVALDIVNGNDDNARVGIALAANIGFGGEYKEHRLDWELGEDWVNAYISWNMGFVLSLKNLVPVKLLIPSVVCTAGRDKGRDFIHRRTLSLAASMLGFVAPHYTLENLDAGIDIDPQKFANIKNGYASYVSSGSDRARKTLVMSAGKANIDNVVLTNPSQDKVEKMLFNLCGTFCFGMDQWPISRTSPADHIDDEDYPVYIAIVIWAIVMITGLGLEFGVWMLFLRTDWDDKRQNSWHVAQAVFPLLAMTTLGLAAHQNYMALIFLVAGLFKFGFPEILVNMYLAMYMKRSSKWTNAKEMLNSLGTVLHHSSASLLISALLTGVTHPSRYVMDPILILSIQHWFVMLKYFNELSYEVIETILEVWFEWSVVSQLEVLVYRDSWIVSTAACGMLVAHWIYFAAGFIERFVEQVTATEEKTAISAAIHMEQNVLDDGNFDHKAGDSLVEVEKTPVSNLTGGKCH